jgi:glutaredoxin-related protein
LSFSLTGTPSRPRCGFAGKLIELLDEYDLTYSWYDVMADDDACQALKKFSDWSCAAAVPTNINGPVNSRKGTIFPNDLGAPPRVYMRVPVG